MSDAIAPRRNGPDRSALASSTRRVLRAVGAVLLLGLVVGAAVLRPRERSGAGLRGQGRPRGRSPAVEADRADGAAGTVRLGEAQQHAIGLKTARVTIGETQDVLTAPGRVEPNESWYAYITPRAAGVVRSVTAHVGQDVKAGDLLATIDSPEVGTARLDLYTKLQVLEIARAQADWQEKIHASTLELIERLQKGETPERIHNALADRAVGENREKLMTAYAQYRLAVATIGRNRDLSAQKLITPKQFEKVSADYEVAQATYQSLMDQMGYENRLANTRAQQALRQAQSAVRAAQERLRILGVRPDGTEPEVAGGRVVGVDPGGTLVPGATAIPPDRETPEEVLPPTRGSRGVAVEPPGAHPGKGSRLELVPVSTYSIWAPFDGTILDREMIVPGVAVDITHRIFTIANLETVWVEASVHESDFHWLPRGRKGTIRFRSPAYRGRVFEGEVTYAGDLVDEKSRSVKLLANAANPERLLKPGMFVEVEVVSPVGTRAPRIPTSALLTEGSRSFVFVRTGPDRFDRREVDADPPREKSVTIRSGLEPGEDVVVEGAFKLRSLAAQPADAGA